MRCPAISLFLLGALALVLGGITVLGSPSPVQADPAADANLSYPLVDTGQERCYEASKEIAYPQEGEPFFGQDAQYMGLEARYRDNGDGTVTDLVTGLVWQQTPPSQTFGWKEALAYCDSLELAEHSDWRAPTLKELWSLQNFSTGWPYLDTKVFQLAGRGVGKDQQYWTSNEYRVGTTHGGAHTAFGVNHATGHIKGYPSGRGPQGKHVRAVRGASYGVNDFVDNGDGTITDKATGLTWMKSDSGHLKTGPNQDGRMDWSQALSWAESLDYAGHDDWRLPNVKELQSIVDYSGAFPAVDAKFQCTSIVNEAEEPDYGYYWTSTSAYFGRNRPLYTYAWYVAFGRAVNPMGQDTHGAGAVRFDTKVEGGPAGEGGERIYNFVRCVRGGQATAKSTGPALADVSATPPDGPRDARQGPPPGGPGGERGGPPPGSGGGFVERLDRDGDQKVSREEFDGPDEHFRHIDEDGDGYITEEEAAKGPPPGPPPGGASGGGPGGGPPPRGSGR